MMVMLGFVGVVLWNCFQCIMNDGMNIVRAITHMQVVDIECCFASV